jgi:hypothetical protein
LKKLTAWSPSSSTRTAAAAVPAIRDNRDRGRLRRGPAPAGGPLGRSDTSRA